MASPKNTVCLWYDKDAEEAARFYAATFPDSAVGAVTRAPADYPSGQAGQVLVVEFTLFGIPCIGLPGGQLLPLREDALALPVDAERGATGLMLFEGIHQLLTTTFGASANLAAASDSADATVKRRDHRPT